MAQKFYKKVGVQVAIVTACGAIIVALITVGYQRSEIRQDNRVLKDRLDQTRSALADTKSERDKYQIQLAPFLATANQSFSNAPPDKRLDLLIEKMDKVMNTVRVATHDLTAWREITSDQRIKLLALLKDGPKGIVYLRPKSFDAETEQYGKQMASILREVGFDVRECEEATLSWSLTGAFLLVKNLQKLPPHALFVQNSFRAVDILLAAYENPNVPDDSIMIGIGERF